MLLEISQLTEVITEKALPCPKCNGSGYLQQHRRISGGVCFKCDGKGTSNRTQTTITETVTTTLVNAEILEDNETFEAMLERRQVKEAKTQEMIDSGNFNIFDWYEANA